MDEQDKKNKSLKNVFGEAMQYFGPGMIAAIGTKDPMEIHRAYIQGMTMMRQDEELELNRQVRIEQSRAELMRQLQPSYDLGFVDKVTGNVVKTDKRTGQAFTLDGTEIPAANVMHEETYRQGKSLTRRDDTIGIQRDTLDLKKLKASELSDKQVSQHAAVKKVLATIEDIKRLKPGVNTGPVAAKWQGFLALFGKAPSDFVQMKTATTTVIANYIKSMSGTAVSNQERRLLMNAIPRVEDDDKTFNDKIMQFERLVKIGGAEFLAAIETGQPLRQELTQKMLQGIDRSVLIGQQMKDDSSFESMLDEVLKLKNLEKMGGQ
jgi:hypothetical protein